jgi:hypothetical protein
MMDSFERGPLCILLIMAMAPAGYISKYNTPDILKLHLIET